MSNNTGANTGRKHVSLFEPITFIVGVICAALTALVCMTIMGKIGIVPNTSIIGALVAITLGRTLSAQFRSLERQNLIQTITSGGGFGAGNAIFVPVAVMLIMGRTDLFLPMLLGATIGAVSDVWLIGKVYDSPIFPSTSTWPLGIATAAAIIAGDEGGKKARQLLEGLSIGIIGTVFKVPMAGIGIAFYANRFAMIALGLGLVIRGYSPTIFGLDLGTTYIPHGVMIGGSIVQLWQAYKALVFKKLDKKQQQNKAAEEIDTSVSPENVPSVSKPEAMRGLNLSLGLFMLGAVVVSALSALWVGMPIWQLLLFVLLCTLGAWSSTIICGMCAMNAGWFPSTSIVVIFLAFATFLKFPALPLAIFAGYLASTGPVFSDMGYDLKTGWILRKKKGYDKAYELDGRRQQVYAEIVGVLVAMVMVWLFGKIYFNQGMIPPFPKIFKGIIEAGGSPAILREMLIWAIPGALLQFIGGAQRAMGILLGVGLLINYPVYGLGVLSAVVVRFFLGEARSNDYMGIRAAGFLVGDGLHGFFSAIMRTYF